MTGKTTAAATETPGLWKNFTPINAPLRGFPEMGDKSINNDKQRKCNSTTSGFSCERRVCLITRNVACTVVNQTLSMPKENETCPLRKYAVLILPRRYSIYSQQSIYFYFFCTNIEK
ncbi:MAG: hypothetical protein ACYC26_16035 [Phycisphaerales bacterium]